MPPGELKIIDLRNLQYRIDKFSTSLAHLSVNFDITVFVKRFLPIGYMRDVCDLQLILRWPTYDRAYWKLIMRDIFYIYGSDTKEVVFRTVKTYKTGFTVVYNLSWTHQTFTLQFYDTHCRYWSGYLCASNLVVLDVYQRDGKFSFVVSNVIPPASVVRKIDDHSCVVKANVDGIFELLPSKQKVSLAENQTIVVRDQNAICYLGV